MLLGMITIAPFDWRGKSLVYVVSQQVSQQVTRVGFEFSSVELLLPAAVTARTAVTPQNCPLTHPTCLRTVVFFCTSIVLASCVRPIVLTEL